MSRNRQCRYQIECPHCKEFFAWHHECTKNNNLSAERGTGDKHMEITRWVKVNHQEPEIQNVIDFHSTIGYTKLAKSL
jgi:hypothetical protein